MFIIIVIIILLVIHLIIFNLAGSRNQVPWTEADEYFRHLIAHYRARVESVIKRIKSHAWCTTVFRGRFETFARLFDITVLMTALQIRHEFLMDGKMMFECVGPWPHNFT